jgi:RecB family exonuclease
LEAGAAADSDVVQSIARHQGLSAEDTERLSQAADAFRQAPIARLLSDAQEVRREMPFAIPIGETVLVGSVDLAARLPGKVVVIDYKTGDPSTADEASRRLQAASYALPAMRWANEPVDVVFAYLDGTEERIELGERALEDLLESEIVPLIDGITAGEFPPLDAYDYVLCGSCPGSMGLCPVARRTS